MIKTNVLKGIMAEKNISGKEVAEYIGFTPKTFYKKMKNGVFGSDEIEKMIELLEIDNPIDVFFAPNE